MRTAAATTATAAAAERKRCRTSPVTGSLAQRVTVCRTAAEWRRLENREQDDANNLIDRSRSSPCGECQATPSIGIGSGGGGGG